MSPKPDPRAAGRLFVLDLSGGRVLSMKTDGSDETVIAAGCHLPDGIAIDTRAGHVYWTNMGVPSREDGSIAFRWAARSRRSSAISTRTTASSTGAIARGCA